jgi:SAM-dependent methyltransferase
VLKLRQLLDCRVIGTDIAPTALAAGLVQMDFHCLPPRWHGRFDFVYSNSLDHSHDPAKAVNAWVQSLRQGGRLYLSHCANSERAQNLADCYGATLQEYTALVHRCCTYLHTLRLGDQINPDGGSVKRLSIIVGERPPA